MKKKVLYLAAAAALTIVSLCACGNGADSLSDGSELLNSGSASGVEISDVSEDDASSALMDFTLDFMKSAIENAEDENPVLSGASAYEALTLLACGSSGDTSAELSTVLRIPEGEWASYGSAVKAMLNRSEDTTVLKSADSVWFDKDEEYKAKQEYLDTMSALGSDVYETDLQSEGAVKDINGWVSDKTEGLIEKLREKPYDDLVRAALLNALYFEAKWENPFLAEMTEKEEFTTSGGETIETDFVRDYETYRYYVNTDKAEGILLPYESGDMAFLAVRAKDGSTPAELLSTLTADDLQEMTDIDDTTYMNFSMPKFDVNYNQVLNDVFADIGLEKTMNENGGADLTNMFDTQLAKSMIIDAAQVVRVQVDEEGTKAAAVTEITTAETAFIEEPEPVELHFDSPFLYAIVDTETAVPLFMGIMENPQT